MADQIKKRLLTHLEANILALSVTIQPEGEKVRLLSQFLQSKANVLLLTILLCGRMLGSNPEMSQYFH